MSVYFITAREVGKVKIGCASNPFSRLSHMRTCCPVDLKLEAIFKGAYKEEKEYHARFADHRIRGEWFNLCEEIEALIGDAPRPTRPISVADKRRLAAMHTRGQEWAERQRKEDERTLAEADVYFPFRERTDA